MKLVQKLAAALVLGTCAILVGNGYLRVEREIAVLREDRQRDLRAVGRALAAAAAAVWKSEGSERAVAMLAATSREGDGVRVRWVKESAPPSDGVRVLYVPIEVDGVRSGALELSQSLEPERRRVHTIVIDTVMTTAALLLVSGALSVLLGIWLVGRPVRALAEKARRIGQGDFSGPIALRSRDELHDLATEMNAMCERLLDAHHRAERETAARIAALEQLRHADRLMTVGKLASGIAHELGTPLNVVSARASMIAGGEVTESDARDYANVIHEAAKRMTRIIRQLLEFARQRVSQRTRSDVRAVTRDTLELLRTLAEKRQVALHLASGDDDPMASVDVAQIQQVITNLVVNAVHASASGKRVEISVSRARCTPPADHGGAESDYVRIRVCDEGHGIAADDLPRIFEPFFTTKDVGEGTGLGLSVTYGIVHDHGGFIVTESRVNEGSAFSVYLPRGELP